MFSLFFMLLPSASVLAVNPISIKCQSHQIVEGWKGYSTREKLFFEAQALSESILQSAEINGAYASDVREITVNPNYRPQSDRYKNYLKYNSLEDAWHNFYVLLPKGFFGSAESSFTGYVQIFNEQGFEKTVSLRCERKE